MKNSKIKKSLLIALSSVVALSMITGCGKKNDTTTTPETPTSSPDAPKEVSKLKDFQGLEFSWYIHYDWAGDQGWANDLTTKYIQDTYGVKVNWVTSGGAAKQKLATMITSDELPDVITLDRGADTDQMVQGGVLVPLDSYVEKYPSLMKWAGPKVINALKSPVDGKFYGVPSWYTNEEHPLGNSGIVLNQKYYKDLGSPKIDNMDDLYEYLKSLKAKYPNVVPFSGQSAFGGGNVLYSLFGENRDKEAAGKFFYKAGNELKYIYEDLAYQEYLLFANKLYREGLMSPDDFTMKGEQWTEKASTGKIGVYAAVDSLNSVRGLIETSRKTDPTALFGQIEPPAKAGLDKSKITTSTYGAVGWNHTVITNKAKDAEKIYAFIDFITGEEGSAITTYGPKGLYWNETIDYKGAKVPVKTDKWNDREKDDGVGKIHWISNGAWAAIASEYDWEKNPPAEGDWDPAKEAKIARAHAFNTDEYINLTPAPTTEEGIIFKSVEEMSKNHIAKVILSKSEEDAKKEIQNAIANAEKLGFNKTLKIMTENWQKNLKKIQGK